MQSKIWMLATSERIATRPAHSRESGNPEKPNAQPVIIALGPRLRGDERQWFGLILRSAPRGFDIRRVSKDGPPSSFETALCASSG